MTAEKSSHTTADDGKRKAKPAKVYVVFGQTGEYSDRTEWPVRAYLNKSKAEEMVLRCSQEANRLAVTYPDRYSCLALAKKAGDGHRFDPDFDRDYTGTNYYIVDVELEAA